MTPGKNTRTCATSTGTRRSPTASELGERLLPLKTLTDITKYPDMVQDLTNAVGLHVPPPAVVSRRPTAYTAESIREDGCFLPRSTIEKLLARLESKKNLILQGPPGTGKTWLRQAPCICAHRTPRPQRHHSHPVVHPTLSYEDFVLGWRPGVDGRLKLNDGVFLRAIETAKRRSTPHVVVIEEINRGNPAQIFGELITLLEADKRAEDEAVELAYTDGSEPRIAWLPPNLYVIGTMNIADRSLALVDLALAPPLRLRDPGNRHSAPRGEPGSPTGWASTRRPPPTSNAASTLLNDAIAADSTLGPQFRIGHSYVTPSEPLEPGTCRRVVPGRRRDPPSRSVGICWASSPRPPISRSADLLPDVSRPDAASLSTHLAWLSAPRACVAPATCKPTQLVRCVKTLESSVKTVVYSIRHR